MPVDVNTVYDLSELLGDNSGANRDRSPGLANWQRLRPESRRVSGEKDEERKCYWIRASTATATNNSVRYVVDQWNRRIGRTGSPQPAPAHTRCASTSSRAPTSAAVNPYSGVIPSGHNASEAATVSQEELTVSAPTPFSDATTGS